MTKHYTVNGTQILEIELVNGDHKTLYQPKTLIVKTTNAITLKLFIKNEIDTALSEDGISLLANSEYKFTELELGHPIYSINTSDEASISAFRYVQMGDVPSHPKTVF